MRVALIRARLVVSQHRSRGLQLVIDLGAATTYPWPASIAAVRRMGPVIWKISE